MEKWFCFGTPFCGAPRWCRRRHLPWFDREDLGGGTFDASVPLGYAGARCFTCGSDCGPSKQEGLKTLEPNPPTKSRKISRWIMLIIGLAAMLCGYLMM